MFIVKKILDINKDKVNLYKYIIMARIAGIDLKPNLKAKFSLAAIYGVGFSSANKILLNCKVDPEKRMSQVTDEEVARIKEMLEKNVKIEGELRQEIFRNVKRLKDIRSYRGIRHKLNLPTKGQRTRTNARTRKGKSMAVGGLKRVLTKT